MHSVQANSHSQAAVLADKCLVDRCLQGESRAWDDLYQLCHPTITSTAMTMLWPRPDARQVSDEIAARVWVQLISRDCRLLRRFDAQRGCRLQAYVAKISRNQTANYRKSEKRRRTWEILVAESDRLEPANCNASGPLDPELPKAFFDSLTPREREFCDFHLISTQDAGQSSAFSPANVRQLRCRLRKKLQSYLATEG